VYPNLTSLSEAAAETITKQILTVAPTSRFNLALSGGNTPRTLYRILSTKYQDRIPWERVHLFWGDERYVPSEDARSNYRTVREGLLNRIRIPVGNVHPMRTDFRDPADAAKTYETVLRDYFVAPWPSLNLVLLGLGADGHTASLFPNSQILQEGERWVMAVTTDIEPRVRLTLTLPVIAHADQIFLLVVGGDKAKALQQTLTGKSDLPAAKLFAERPDIVFWTDETASRHVKHS